MSKSEPIVGATSLELQTCRSKVEGVQTIVIPSFRDYGHVADFDFWECYHYHLKVVSDHQLKLIVRIVSRALYDYMNYIYGIY